MNRSLTFIVVAGLCMGDFSAHGAARRAPKKQKSKSVQMNSRKASAEARARALRRSLFKTSGPTVFAPSTSEPWRVAPPATPAPPIAREASSGPGSTRELGLQPTGFTPYDRYLGTVRSVIDNLDERGADMLLACELMREGRGFRYSVRDPYRPDPPTVTAARRAGDCKSKALWLYDHLGDPEALFVIGKLQRRSKTSHAWVYWRNQGQWWILDPTDSTSPLAAESVSHGRYVPYYSYGKGGAYRHPATSLMLTAANLQTQTPAVAVQPARSDPTETRTPRAGTRTAWR